jgi:hypothetical protein
MKKLTSISLIALLIMAMCGLAGATLSDKDPIQTYSCSGSTGPYTFSYPIFDEGDLTVIKTDSDGNETTLTLTTVYRVSLDDDAPSAGSITLEETCDSPDTLAILRDTGFSQETEYTPGGIFPAKAHEHALDREVMLIQELRHSMYRAPKVTKGSGLSDLVLPVSGGKIIGWNDAGDALELKPYPSTGNIMLKGTYDTNENGVVDTASALNANGSNCNAGEFPLGVSASGAAEGCSSAWTGDVIGDAYIANDITLTDVGQASNWPDPSGNGGKYLKTDGSTYTWDSPSGSGDMTKATYDTDTNDTVDAAETLEDQGGGNNIQFEVMALGDWDMSSDATLSTASHGIPLAKIISVTAIIRNDANTTKYPIPGGGGSSVDCWVYGVGTNIGLKRASGGFFDSTDFDSTSYNRGYAIIEYTE